MGILTELNEQELEVAFENLRAANTKSADVIEAMMSEIDALKKRLERIDERLVFYGIIE